MLAAQGYGAAIGNVVAPHNIIAGAAAVGLVAREGEILRATAPVCGLLAAVAGALLALALAL
jgi:lactate permease